MEYEITTIRNKRLVHDGLVHRPWIGDIRGALGVCATVEYVDLWRPLRSVILSSEPDIIRWRWFDSGAYTAASCYMRSSMDPPLTLIGDLHGRDGPT